MRQISDFPMSYQDEFFRAVKRSDGSVDLQPCDPEHEHCDVNGQTRSGKVTIFRSAVTVFAGGRVYSADPARIDPSKQIFAVAYPLDRLSPLEKAVFTLGHEYAHVLDPPYRGDIYQELKEWDANYRGQLTLEQFRKLLNRAP
jgi:hypothetical protein